MSKKNNKNILTEDLFNMFGNNKIDKEILNESMNNEETETIIEETENVIEETEEKNLNNKNTKRKINRFGFNDESYYYNE